MRSLDPLHAGTALTVALDAERLKKNCVSGFLVPLQETLGASQNLPEILR
ncbi:hypothetical protein [Microvirga sp. VF16]|nr:hypothetical protein [Microvirga sp. VF16]QRM36099.1 hypothetical protein JO965_45915 [Microvirga sp. VF16]